MQIVVPVTGRLVLPVGVNSMSLRDRLIRWFKKNPGFHASGDMQRMVANHTTYTSSNTDRRLRELREDGILKVELRKGHAWYSFIDNS